MNKKMVLGVALALVTLVGCGKGEIVPTEEKKESHLVEEVEKDDVLATWSDDEDEKEEAFEEEVEPATAEPETVEPETAPAPVEPETAPVPEAPEVVEPEAPKVYGPEDFQRGYEEAVAIINGLIDPTQGGMAPDSEEKFLELLPNCSEADGKYLYGKLTEHKNQGYESYTGYFPLGDHTVYIGFVDYVTTGNNSSSDSSYQDSYVCLAYDLESKKFTYLYDVPQDEAMAKDWAMAWGLEATDMNQIAYCGARPQMIFKHPYAYNVTCDVMAIYLGENGRARVTYALANGRNSNVSVNATTLTINTPDDQGTIYTYEAPELTIVPSQQVVFKTVDLPMDFVGNFDSGFSVHTNFKWN